MNSNAIHANTYPNKYSRSMNAQNQSHVHHVVQLRQRSYQNQTEIGSDHFGTKILT